MPVPTPTAEPFVSCINLGATLGGVTADIMDGGFTINGSQDDMTNNQGGGWEADAPTTLSADIDLTIAWTTATGLQVNKTYPLLINVATMPSFTLGTFTAPTPVVPGGAFAGQVRILSASAPVLNVKGGFKITLKGKSQGQATYSY